MLDVLQFIRYTGLVLWGIYNTIIVIILLNLLIALMNVAMEAIVENKVASWKYQRLVEWVIVFCKTILHLNRSSFNRTQVWMDYCQRSVVLPSPFNIAAFLADIVVFMADSPLRTCARLCRCRDPEEEGEEELRRQQAMQIKEKQYNDLLRGLVAKYMNDCSQGKASGALGRQQHFDGQPNLDQEAETATKDAIEGLRTQNANLNKDMGDRLQAIETLLKKKGLLAGSMSRLFS